MLTGAALTGAAVAAGVGTTGATVAATGAGVAVGGAITTGVGAGAITVGSGVVTGAAATGASAAAGAGAGASAWGILTMIGATLGTGGIAAAVAGGALVTAYACGAFESAAVAPTVVATTEASKSTAITMTSAKVAADAKAELAAIAAVMTKLKEINLQLGGGVVIVHVWRPRKEDGKFRTSFRGVVGGEVGHVSLNIFVNTPLGIDRHYVSFWPTWQSFPSSKNDTKGIEDPNGSIGAMNDFIGDITSEGRMPDVSIPFFGLNMLNIVKACKELEQRTNANKMRWYLKVPLNIEPSSDKRNCGTAAWKILQAGGIDRYQPEIGGPKDSALRKKYKCDEGRLLWGWFDAAPWRKTIASPVLILHLVASAREKERAMYPLTIPIEDLALSLYPQYLDDNNPIIPVNELPDNNTKGPSNNDIAQMVIPFALFGNQLKKAGFQTSHPTPWRHTNAQSHKTSYNETYTENQSQNSRDSINAFFYNQKATRNVTNMMNVLRRVIK